MSGYFAERRLYHILDTNGDGTGTTNANVNGSVTPVRFKFQPAANEDFKLERLLVQVGDTAPGGLSADGYGDLSALTNGLGLGIYQSSDDTQVLDLTSGLPIKDNADWGRVCYDASLDNYGTGDDFLRVRWTFSKDADQPLTLTDDHYFGLVVNDDLTGLTRHYFSLRGWRVRP